MEKFIYVFDQEAKIRLCAQGLPVLYADPDGKFFVFPNEPVARFSLAGLSYTLSDRLTF